MRLLSGRWLPFTALVLIPSVEAGQISASGPGTLLLQARMIRAETSWQEASFEFQLKNVGPKEMRGCLGSSYGWEFDGLGDEGAIEVLVDHSRLDFKLRPGQVFTWEKNVHFEGGAPAGVRARFHFDIYRPKCKGKYLYQVHADPTSTQLEDTPSITEGEE